MVALFVCIAFHVAALSDHAGADQLGDLRHGQSAGHADRLRLAAPALHRPHFRRDVLDYIITMGCIGAAVMTLLYLIVWFGGGGDLTDDALGDDDHGSAYMGC